MSLPANGARSDSQATRRAVDLASRRRAATRRDARVLTTNQLPADRLVWSWLHRHGPGARCARSRQSRPESAMACEHNQDGLRVERLAPVHRAAVALLFPGPQA